MFEDLRFEDLRFEDLRFDTVLSFLESEIKTMRCIQPPQTLLSNNIRKCGLPFYQMKDNVCKYLKTVGSPKPIEFYRQDIIFTSECIDILILEISTEIESMKDQIYSDMDPTLIVNNYSMINYWVQYQQYEIVNILVDFFKEFIDVFEYDKLDILVGNIFAYGAEPLTRLFFPKCCLMISDIMFLYGTVFENQNEHMVDYLIEWATLTGKWNEIFVNKNHRITQIIIDSWHSNEKLKSKLAKFLCSRQDKNAIKLVTTLPFDEIIEICSNPHPDAVTYSINYIKQSDNFRFHFTGLYGDMIRHTIQNSHPDIVDYVIENAEKFHEFFSIGLASTNTNPKMISFLLANPSYIDLLYFFQNPSIVDRIMK